MRLRLVLITIALLPSSKLLAADRVVRSATEIREAFSDAAPGDTITIAPGTYSFDRSMWTGADGEPGRPITIKADATGEVRLDFSSQEAIVINHPHWVLDRLWINAACEPLSNCSAGLGVKPPAHNFLIVQSRLTNWYQHIKGSRESGAEVEDAAIVGCELYNTIARSSQPIDIVGGKRWRIIGNYVHDFGFSQNGNYGIFLKGATSDGVIEQNLVLCAKDLPPRGATLGISLGQGGTAQDACPNGSCACEDTNSVVRNNIVAHCSDAGLHALRACGGKFFNNTVYDTFGGLQIQIDSPNAPVEIRNNLMGKKIFGGTNYVESNNLLEVEDSVFQQIYAEPGSGNFGDGADVAAAQDRGMVLSDVTSDYCGSLRQGSFDFGAIEFPASCLTWPWTPARVQIDPPVGSDAGVTMPTNDAGLTQPSTDGGVTDPLPVADAGVSGGNNDMMPLDPTDEDRIPGGTSGGCACSTDEKTTSNAGYLFAILFVAFLLVRRRR
jgi:MYXO-CTERM domain-containing protein